MTSADLLKPLSTRQQQLVELIGEAFLSDEDWPIFDYLEGSFERDGLNASETLESIPRMGQWKYGAVRCESGRPTPSNPDEKVALTLVGIHHCQRMRPFVPSVLEVVKLMSERRRDALLSTKQPRHVEIPVAEVRELFLSQRKALDAPWFFLLYELMRTEPRLASVTGGVAADWSIIVGPSIRDPRLSREGRPSVPYSLACLPAATEPETAGGLPGVPLRHPSHGEKRTPVRGRGSRAGELR